MGQVQFLSYPELKVWKIYEHEACITDIKYSSNRTFIAIVDVCGKLSILRRESTEIVTLNNVHFFAWHPWQETDLIIGCANPAEIMVYDLTTKTNRAYYKRTDHKYWLHAIAINPLSAELVASFAHEDGESSEILVMASMNRIIDNISAHNGAVNFIMWNPTGTHVGELNVFFHAKDQRKFHFETSICFTLERQLSRVR